MHIYGVPNASRERERENSHSRDISVTNLELSFRLGDFRAFSMRDLESDTNCSRIDETLFFPLISSVLHSPAERVSIPVVGGLDGLLAEKLDLENCKDPTNDSRSIYMERERERER